VGCFLSSIDPVRLSAFIASRICHDLVSPVSSVTNALDLLNEPGDAEMKAEVQSLLQEGADKAAARIEFLRYAFGSVGLNPGAADIHAAKRITEQFVKSHRPSVEWDIQTDHLSFSHARLMMNLVMLAIDTLPRGGVVSVRIRNETNGMMMTLTCKGDRAKLKEDSARAVAGSDPVDGWRAENIQPLFARMICEGLGGTLVARQNEASVVFTAAGIRAEG
jgi:histidine phosphotransferase ChpT